MESRNDIDGLDPDTALAMLGWQVDLGATEAICDRPLNRYDMPDTLTASETPLEKAATTRAATNPVNPADFARDLAQGAADLDALKATIGAFDLCELKKGARNLVFSDGVPGARIMVIGEAPGKDEDQQGKPFVGRAGKLLDAMFAAIDHGRAHPVNPIYITNILPWRPPQNRDPSPDEIAMMLPFMRRHIELAKPELLVLMGNISCQAILGKRGITKLRGHWTEAEGLPALPMFHPAYLLRTPEAKSDAWQDLLMLKARLRKRNVVPHR